jgi:hypothetical protein
MHRWRVSIELQECHENNAENWKTPARVSAAGVLSEYPPTPQPAHTSVLIAPAARMTPGSGSAGRKSEDKNEDATFAERPT